MDNRDELSTLLEQVAHRLGRHLLDAPLEECGLREVSAALGLAIDKMQVLRGEPSVITGGGASHTHEERTAKLFELLGGEPGG